MEMKQDNECIIQGLRGKQNDIERREYEQNITTAVLTEIKWKGAGIQELRNYTQIKIAEYKLINGRIITTNLNINGHKTSAVKICISNEDKDLNDKDKFLRQIQ